MIRQGGAMQTIAEVLTQTNEILLDAVWVEANGATGHKFLERTSLPSGSWRKLNDGVGYEKSAAREKTETPGMLESFSKVDKALVDLAANPAEFRFSEDSAFLQGLGQTFASAFFYADTVVDPEKFKGLAPRLGASAAKHVILNGGSGSDLTSIYVVNWGVGHTHMIYPKGFRPGGIEMEDLGQQLVDGETAGTSYLALVTHFKMACGLVVKDPSRDIHRIANIETAGADNLFNAENLITVLNNMSAAGGFPVIYCNSTIKTQMDIAAEKKSNVNLQWTEAWGGKVLAFRGVPIRQCDAILDTESAIS